MGQQSKHNKFSKIANFEGSFYEGFFLQLGKGFCCKKTHFSTLPGWGAMGKYMPFCHSINLAINLVLFTFRLPTGYVYCLSKSTIKASRLILGRVVLCMQDFFVKLYVK